MYLFMTYVLPCGSFHEAASFAEHLHSLIIIKEKGQMAKSHMWFFCNRGLSTIWKSQHQHPDIGIGIHIFNTSLFLFLVKNSITDFFIWKDNLSSIPS